MSLEQHVNNVRNMLLADMEKSKTIIFDGLLNNSLVNKIPESLFVNYFLPCFLGKSNNPNWVMEWISIAGSPMAEVGVFNDNTKEILYYVPSILNSNSLFLHKEDGDFGDIFSRFEQINNNMPIEGLNFLVEALNSKNEKLLNKINFSEINKKWSDILVRYGLISALPIEDTSKSNSRLPFPLEDVFEI